MARMRPRSKPRSPTPATRSIATDWRSVCSGRSSAHRMHSTAVVGPEEEPDSAGGRQAGWTTRRGSTRPEAGGWSPRSTSGSRSMSPGQTMVPNSRSTLTASKTSRSSRIDANTPPTCSSPPRSTSCTAPSPKARRSQYPASGSTWVTVVRDELMAAAQSALAARAPACAPSWLSAHRDALTPILAPSATRDPADHPAESRPSRSRSPPPRPRRRHEVRRCVISEVHPDDDPVEATDRRHTESITTSTDVGPGRSPSTVADPRPPPDSSRRLLAVPYPRRPAQGPATERDARLARRRARSPLLAVTFSQFGWRVG